MATVVAGDFEWDNVKAERNLKKHGVTFEEAASAVVDPGALVLGDDSDPAEERYQVIGRSWRGDVLLVIVVERGERDRIVSARRATKGEEERYHRKP